MPQSESYRRLHRAVREVLWKDWDPIGVNHFGPDDEYDSYAPGICRLLMEGADERKIADRLQQLAENAMGLPHVSREHSLHIARRLLSLIDAEATDRD